MLSIIVLTSIGAGLAGLLFWLPRWGARSALRKAAAARVQEMPGPSVVSRLNGLIVHRNAAMTARQREAHASVDPLFRDILPRVDPSLTYRLAQSSAASGFAVEMLPDRDDDAEGGGVMVCARAIGDLLIWTLLQEPALRPSLAGFGPAEGQASQFIQLTATGPEDVTPNAAFIRQFGEDLHPVLSQLATLAGHAGTRLTLTDLGGTATDYRAFSIGEPDSDRVEVLLLPDTAQSTNHQRATEALAKLPIGLMQFDLQGKLIWANDQATQIMGSDERCGDSIQQIFTSLGRPIPALLEDVMIDQQNRRGTMVRLVGNKTGGFLQISLIRAELDGLDCFLALVTDASELRELEDRFAQSQKMEAVGKLAGGVAHDFNNVLTAIKGHCDFVLMGKEQSNPDYEDLIQIRQNSNRAASMVRHLLAFSRQQTLQPQMLNLRDVISDAHVFLNSVIGERVVLQIDHERDVWPVMADQHQLEQVLMNLVVNARDAMKEGGVIHLATRNLALPQEQVRNGIAIPPDNYVEIAVTDGGTGIPDKVLGRVFDPFFTTKPQGQGTGLGLSTVYGIVKQTGGFIFAENLPEKGACFRILLPSETPTAAKVEVEGPVVEVKRDLTGQASVLLVEDEDSIRSVGSRALKLRGYKVHEAASAEEAMEMLSVENIPVDILVSDVVMPGMDGPTFAVKAREMRPGLRLIFVSGYAEDNFQNADLGEDFLFLPKPFSISELTTKVKEALEETV